MTVRRVSFCVLFGTLSFISFAQNPLEQMLQQLPPRELGPGTMGGRIMDIAVFEKDPRIFYVGAATGGVWVTTNGGMTYDKTNHDLAGSIGALDVSQKDVNLVWAGTGEPSSRNSSGFGNGVYKSTDGGKTWTNMGLRNTRHIGEIHIDPRNNDHVYVAALGNLWGRNDERGLYKTTDGGKTWNRILFVSDRAGAVDVDIDPKNPDIVYASFWERERKPYDMVTAGPGSGLWKSTDAGKTWKKITNGLPTGDVGRVGVDISRSNPNIVYAIVAARTGGLFKSTDRGETWTRVNNSNPRPFYFSTLAVDPNTPDRVFVLGVDMHITEDGGRTVRVLNSRVHSDHHTMWINPANSRHIIQGNDGGVAISQDGGTSWDAITAMSLGQFYDVEFDMRKPYWVYGGLQDNGSWGGPTQTRKGGVQYFDWISVGGGDGFTVHVDPNDWTTVYSESQGGAIQRSDQLRGGGRFIRPNVPGTRLRFNWHTPFDLSPHNSTTVYAGSQFLHRSVNRGDSWEVISPDLTTNNPDWQKPPQGDIDSGAERYCTITTLAESRVRPGIIWVGTDDGNVQVTQDGGKTWENVRPNISGVPEFTYVTRVAPSRTVAGRCYVTLDNKRRNDYKPYVFVTEDFGKTWKNISAGLPEDGTSYCITEGVQNPDLLLVGTEFGMYVSIDRGATWAQYNTGEWPTVRVDDIEIHTREHDIIVGTHGRSIWIIPGRALEEMTAENRAKDIFVARPVDIQLLGRTFSAWFGGDRPWMSPNTQPGTWIFVHLKDQPAENTRIQLQVKNSLGVVVETINQSTPATKGLNALRWQPRGRTATQPGDYTVDVIAGNLRTTTGIRVEDLAQNAPVGTGL